MFRFHRPLDIVTVFHKTGSAASMRAAAVMNSLSAKAGATSVEDKPSDSQTALPEFELNITEDPPTQDQLKTILEYVGANKIGSIINGASTEKEALKKFRENSETFQRPVIVDWNNGKAVASDNESEILKMLQQQASSKE
ncbi:DUF1687-domain-containing protein [Hypoxylon fragiforme]|uniref:DUF1687-domain-containing protein n=1 Tax=Hypoxylon fragiforme TaxID=63214 RepID=UPI0020C60D13|nr:DUF1687-domain-containing protein [Hypoxylon fragiforme]KAI2604730.1 DUF1687-domain-containing protein [Hypoxylon fragiforme]